MKLTERQFYNLATRKKETVKSDDIKLVKYKNGSYAMVGLSKDNTKLFKIISQDKLNNLEDKYGKSRKYRR